jgi:hypothetical protein
MTVSLAVKEALARLEALPISKELDLLWAKYKRSVILHGDETVESHYSKTSWREEHLQPLKNKIADVTGIQMRTPEFNAWIQMLHLSQHVHPLFVKRVYNNTLLKRSKELVKRSEELTDKTKALLKNLQ